jgi:CrcB protein
MTSSTNSSRRQQFWNSAALYGFVALGGMIGSCTRYLVSVFAQILFGSGFPLGTLFVNITGSFAIGFYAALAGPDGRIFASTRQRQFVMTGLCGGYTTFSAFSFETFQLLRNGHELAALLNIGLAPAWLVAVWLGHTLATRINRRKAT